MDIAFRQVRASYTENTITVYQAYSAVAEPALRLASEFPAWPQYGDEERAGLLRALEQGQWWRMGGAEVDAFEDEFAAYHGGDAPLPWNP